MFTLLQFGVSAMAQTGENIEKTMSPHQLSWHGYVRTGIGGSNSGQMVNFLTPGNVHKYRLGNEANSYSELTLNYKYKEQDKKESFQVYYTVAKFNPYGERFEEQKPYTAQLYVEMSDLFKDQSKLWAGRKYYDRQYADMIDYFWLNTGQTANYGVGIKDILWKKNKLNFAFFQFKYRDKTNPGVKDLNSYTFDVRLKEMFISLNVNLNFVGLFSYRTEDVLHTLAAKKGFGMGGWLNYKKGFITHVTSVIYRKGPQMTQNGYTGQGLYEFQDKGGKAVREYDLDKSYSFIMGNFFQYEQKKNYTLHAILTYVNKSYGIGNVDENKQSTDNRKTLNILNLGGRYIKYISKHFNIAVEAGNEYVKDSRRGVEGSMQKISLVPQISWDYGYYSRPVLRFFVTYAHWSDSFKGMTGIDNNNLYFKDKTNGLTYGVQIEYWW
ncbi:MAG: carbohydrate porin [Bergeyella sp.]|nr:carbohydrate porin [Bergeyella sp.]